MVPGIAYKSITNSVCICIAVATLSYTHTLLYTDYNVICKQVAVSKTTTIS